MVAFHSPRGILICEVLCYIATNPLRTDLHLSPKSECKKILVIILRLTLLKPHNIGTHLKGIETSFQVVALFLKSFLFWMSYIIFWNFWNFAPYNTHLAPDLKIEWWLDFVFYLKVAFGYSTEMAPSIQPLAGALRRLTYVCMLIDAVARRGPNKC
jgi:hypothetical protein